jgi:hypothetical protein
VAVDSKNNVAKKPKQWIFGPPLAGRRKRMNSASSFKLLLVISMIRLYESLNLKRSTKTRGHVQEEERAILFLDVGLERYVFAGRNYSLE